MSTVSRSTKKSRKIKDSYQLKKLKIQKLAKAPTLLSSIAEDIQDIGHDIIGQSSALVKGIKAILTPEFIHRMRDREAAQKIVQHSME